MSVSKEKPEDGGSRFLQNITTYALYYTVSHYRW